MTFRLVTWNINSVRARVGLLAQLAQALNPDVICLQEIKVENDKFPTDAITEIGYGHQAVFGMKAYHGVATLSKQPLTKEVRHNWCGKDDARHIAVTVAGNVELHNLYIPAGGDVPDPALNDKFAHKLQFFEEQTAWWSEQKGRSRRILVGDLNVAPLETDVWSHKQLLKVVSHTPIEVEHYARMEAAHGWVDAVRHVIPPADTLYSWWSYRARDWRASNKGRRLDHVWVTPALKGAVKDAFVYDEARDWEKASDHAPVVVDLDL